jgi:hypothetical protein
MFDGMKMLGGVFIFGGIAAAHVAAYQAQAQVYPAVAHFDAFGADVRSGGGDFHFVQVFALFWHFILQGTDSLTVAVRSRAAFEGRAVPLC